MFREEYDHLNKATQRVLWRLVSDHQRLAQLTETSKDYLSTPKNLQFQKQSVDVRSWIAHVCERHHVIFHLNQDRELYLPFYWLSLCLGNLIRNACQHGNGEIIVDVNISKKLRIEVSDNGIFPNQFYFFMGSFRKKHKANNMGIGLSIVSHLMTKMGGKLVILRKPTRCIMELPL
jgi:K+-sensing histidine kinase KdpD